MNDNEKNFRSWFVDTLDVLRTNGNSGFIFTLITFPLLERYLREKSGAGESRDLPVQFFDELAVLFPDIASKRFDFWHSYRNGLLHQAAFSKTKLRQQGIVVMPTASLSGSDPRPVYYDSASDGFFLNPIMFYETVVARILSDFTTFEGGNSPSHNLPTVNYPPANSTVSTFASPYFGTTGNFGGTPPSTYTP